MNWNRSAFYAAFAQMTKLDELVLCSGPVPDVNSLSSQTINGAEYVGSYVTVTTQDTDPQGVTISPDGTKLLLVGASSDSVHEYDLTTTGTITDGMTYTGYSVSFSLQDSAPKSVRYSQDGTKLFILGSATATVYEYALTTAGTLAGGVTYTGNSFSVLAQESSVNGMDISPDGSKIIVIGNANDTIYEYALTTAGTLAGGVTYTGNSFSVTSEDTYPMDVCYSHNGKTLFILGYTSDTIYEYALTTVGTLAGGVTYTGNSFSVTSEDAYPMGIALNNQGSRVFMVGNNANAVREYLIDSTIYYENMVVSFGSELAAESNNFFSIIKSTGGDKLSWNGSSLSKLSAVSGTLTHFIAKLGNTVIVGDITATGGGGDMEFSSTAVAVDDVVEVTSLEFKLNDFYA